MAEADDFSPVNEENKSIVGVLLDDRLSHNAISLLFLNESFDLIFSLYRKTVSLRIHKYLVYMADLTIRNDTNRTIHVKWSTKGNTVASYDVPAASEVKHTPESGQVIF